MTDEISLLWTERYRPKTFDDVVGQDNIKRDLQYMISNNKLSHCLFIGNPGCGKTSLAYIIINMLFVDESIYLNSDRIYSFLSALPIAGGVNN